MISTLTYIEAELLLAIAFANDFTLKAHVSIEMIRRHYSRDLRRTDKNTQKSIKLAYKTLNSRELIQKHGGGQKEWQLTDNGLKYANRLAEQALQ